MSRLVVLYKGKYYTEGDDVKINGVSVEIEHITMTGFLFNQSNDSDDYVTVRSDNKTTSYYSSWDYLKFIGCDVEVRQPTPHIGKGMDKKTMTINLTGREMDIVNKLAKEKGITKNGLVRQALRLYQIFCRKEADSGGWRLVWLDENGKEITKMMLIEQFNQPPLTGENDDR